MSLFPALLFLVLPVSSQDDCSPAGLDLEETALHQQVAADWAALEESRGSTDEDTRAALQAFVDRYGGIHVGVSCDEPRAVELPEVQEARKWLLGSDLLGGIGGLIAAKGSADGSGGLAGFRGGFIASGGIPYEGPVLQVGVPEVRGALTVEQVRGVALQHHKAVRYCYQRRILEGLEAQGALEVHLVVAADGTVSKVKVKGDELEDEQLRNCVRARSERLLFPEAASGGKTKATVPLVFGLP